MLLKLLEENLSVCKISNVTEINYKDEFVFVGKTDEEISLVCSTKNLPVNCLESESGWRGFRIEGTLDFSLIGILSKISTKLAENKIGIFVISTFNTDYILIKEENLELAVKVLKEDSYEFI